MILEFFIILFFVIFILYFLSKKQFFNYENDWDEIYHKIKLDEIQKIKEKNLEKHGSRCFSVATDGERELLKKITNELDYKDYYIFSDLKLKNKLIGSSQIDHLVVSKYGIFVIENKDFSGWIFGSEKNKDWQQIIYKSKKRFNNPVWQNIGHIKTLKELFGFDKKVFFNIVAFSNDSEFKSKKPLYTMHYDDVVGYIKNKKEVLINDMLLEQILGKLFILCQTIDIDNEEHIENIHKYLIKNSQNNI